MIADSSFAAEVVALFPNLVRVQVDEIDEFRLADSALRIGSFLEISDNEHSKLLAVVDTFSLAVSENGARKYVLDARPIGTLNGTVFSRGGDELALPPKTVKPATEADIRSLYSTSVKPECSFSFSRISRLRTVRVPVDGNRFFNKHIAVVGSTGSGKSHTVAKLIQEATSSKATAFDGMNNSHIVIFDIHSEYDSAFPGSNVIGIQDLCLPYWLLNSEELEELFIESEGNDHRQRSIFKEAVIANKQRHVDPAMKAQVHYDFPSYFDIGEVLTYARNRNNERKTKGDNGENVLSWRDSHGSPFVFGPLTKEKLFEGTIKADPNGTTGGTLNGELGNFINRLENKIADNRLSFILGEKTRDRTLFETTLRSMIGYKEGAAANVTIIDLSGVPFEVLSITVSLISRLLFEFAYHLRNKSRECPALAPLLLVYEEAHKYVPKSDLSKYRSARVSIERIAKEGRKYGVTLLIASQRPSEISETIFAQCNNFIAMRLTNPVDQDYVKRLLPDSLGDMSNTLPSLHCGEALLVGDAIIIPSLVAIDPCEPPPSSNDVPYFERWTRPWQPLDMASIVKTWQR